MWHTHIQIRQASTLSTSNYQYAEASGLTIGPTLAVRFISGAHHGKCESLLATAEAGATAVTQPGGSRRDAEVIAAADEAGLAMVFTGMRHFRH